MHRPKLHRQACSHGVLLKLDGEGRLGAKEGVEGGVGAAAVELPLEGLDLCTEVGVEPLQLVALGP